MGLIPKELRQLRQVAAAESAQIACPLLSFISSVTTSDFFESTVPFFHNFKILYFFVLFSGLVLFLYFLFINLPEFYQILLKSTVFVLFQEILQNECFANL